MTVRFDAERADRAWLHAWMIGRALARGLPMPIADRNGWRAEIGSESERRRWVFPDLVPELADLAAGITEPGLNLRALATPDAMRDFLPSGWHVQASSYAMTGPAETVGPAVLPSGYRLEIHKGRLCVHAFILEDSGELAASGHGGIGPQAFVFDRVVTQPEHRRRGLGRAIMNALGTARTDLSMPQLLVATEAGRSLYEALGWRVVAPYASASWVGDGAVQN